MTKQIKKLDHSQFDKIIIFCTDKPYFIEIENCESFIISKKVRNIEIDFLYLKSKNKNTEYLIDTSKLLDSRDKNRILFIYTLEILKIKY